MLSFHISSPIPNTILPPKLKPSCSQTCIQSSFSLRKFQVRATSAEVALKEDDKRSNDSVSLAKDLSADLPAGLQREAMPRHVAVIMDGNVRWARQRGLPSSAGHEAGVQSLREVVELCRGWVTKVLTVFRI